MDTTLSLKQLIKHFFLSVEKEIENLMQDDHRRTRIRVVQGILNLNLIHGKDEAVLVLDASEHMSLYILSIKDGQQPVRRTLSLTVTPREVAGHLIGSL